MKICFVADAGTIHAKRWVEWFSKNGHEVHLISRHKPIDMKNIIIHEIKDMGKNRFLKLISFILDVWKVRRLIKRIHPDIVHGHYLLTYGLLGALSGFSPYIATPWGDDIGEFTERSFLRKFLVKFIIKRSDFLNVCDTFCKERLIELGAKNDNIFVNGWGTDITLFKPKRTKDLAFKEKLGLNGFFTIVITRLHRPFETIDFLLKAVSLMSKKIKNAKFIIAGEGLGHIYLKNKIKEMDISGQFVFIGRQTPEKISELMAGSDVYLDLLKRNVKGNTIGSSTQEAMACATPVVIARIPSVTGVIEDGYNGMVFNWKDPSELAGKIITLLKNEKMRKIFGERTRKFAEENFNWEKNSLEMEKFYLKIQKQYNS